MKTKQSFYSLHEITLTEKIIKAASFYLEKPLEESIIYTFDCLAHSKRQPSSYEDGDEKKESFSKNFKDKDPFFKDVKDQVSFFKDLHLFWKEVGMQDFYVFRYKTRIFVLLVGETIMVSNWSINISQTFNQVLNQIKINDRIDDLVDNYNLKDYTYAEADEYPSSEANEEKKRRRLRSLGGGLRRLLLKIKKNDKSLTNKNIIKDLDYFILLGDEEKIKSQIFAVENNTKFNPYIKTKDIIINQLSIDQSFAIIEEKIYQEFKIYGPNVKNELLIRVNTFQKNTERLLSEYKVCNSSFSLRN